MMTRTRKLFTLMFLSLFTLNATAEKYTLYLNFTGDPNFPEYGDPENDNVMTSPLSTFTANSINPAWGAGQTTTLVNNTLAGIAKDYEEFDIEVTTTQPAGDQHQTVGFDGGVANNGGLYGKARGVDSDPTGLDYGRVWAGSYAVRSQWQGANATIPRWTNALVGTGSHEAGHNYGLVHEDSDPTPGELANGVDSADLIMASGVGGRISTEERATNDRYFGDKAYAKLGAVLGLKASTLASYGFKNNNNVAANDFHITLLSEHQQLTPKWESTQDPFGTPTITRSLLKSFVYLGQTYYEYDISWETNIVPNYVLPDQQFKVGLTFNESNDFIITDTYLTRDGVELPVKPRVLSPGNMVVNNNKLYAPVANGGDKRIKVKNLHFKLTSRMTDLEKMNLEGFLRPLSIDGVLVTVLDELIVPVDFYLDPGESRTFEFGDLETWLRTRVEELARHNAAASDAGENEEHYDEVLSSYMELFPSAYIYGMAEVVVEGEQIYHPESQSFITGDITSQVFFQNGGVPMTIPEPATFSFLIFTSLLTMCRRKAA